MPKTVMYRYRIMVQPVAMNQEIHDISVISHSVSGAIWQVKHQMDRRYKILEIVRGPKLRPSPGPVVMSY